MAKTGGHFDPCNVGSVEKHNQRDPEYLKAVEASGKKLYFFPDLTRLNSSWIGHSYSGRSCSQIFDELKQLYIEKVGQAPQLKERKCVNKKTGKITKIAGWSPIREAVIPIKSDTELRDFAKVVQWLRERGWNTIRIDLHKDEGHEDEVTGERKMNLHGHLVVDCIDHQTGRTVKLDDNDMKEFQTVLAESLGMERGISKEVTGAGHRNMWQQKEHAAAQHYKELLDMSADLNESISIDQSYSEELNDKIVTQTKTLDELTESLSTNENRLRQLDSSINAREQMLESMRDSLKTTKKEAQEAERLIYQAKEIRLSRTRNVWRDILLKIWPSAAAAIDTIIRKVNEHRMNFTVTEAETIDAAMSSAQNIRERMDYGKDLLDLAKPKFQRSDPWVENDVMLIAKRERLQLDNDLQEGIRW